MISADFLVTPIFSSVRLLFLDQKVQIWYHSHSMHERMCNDSALPILSTSFTLQVLMSFNFNICHLFSPVIYQKNEDICVICNHSDFNSLSCILKGTSNYHSVGISRTLMNYLIIISDHNNLIFLNLCSMKFNFIKTFRSVGFSSVEQ